MNPSKDNTPDITITPTHYNNDPHQQLFNNSLSQSSNNNIDLENIRSTFLYTPHHPQPTFLFCSPTQFAELAHSSYTTLSPFSVTPPCKKLFSDELGVEHANNKSGEQHSQCEDTTSTPLTEYTETRKKSKRTHRRSKNEKMCCNCKKSKCLKLYCDCLAHGQYCEGCNCESCYNTKEYEQERKIALKGMITKKTYSYKKHPNDNSKSYFNGCQCRKSKCSKKYCECYSNGKMCSKLCKCNGCLNYIEERSVKIQVLNYRSSDISIVRSMKMRRLSPPSMEKYSEFVLIFIYIFKLC